MPELTDFTPQEKVILATAKAHFWFFLQNVYAQSFEGQTWLADDGTRRPYEFAPIHLEWAVLLQYNPRLCLMAPRFHLKSTVLRAYAMWHMFRAQDENYTDIYYFAYKRDLAAEQVEHLSREIKANPYCRFWRDLRSGSMTIINYDVDFGDGIEGEVIMRADGILAATRGRHPRVTICDDILSDFSNPLDSSELKRINRVFRQSIMSLPANADDPLIVAGTPQSYDDILHYLARLEDWLWLAYPAIVDDAEQKVQWPEKYTYERLQVIKRSVGPSAFEVEFLLVPLRVTDQFFTRDDILAVIDDTLPMWDLSKPFGKDELATYGGFDIGRLVHPSHAAVFVELPDRTLVQVYQRFLDRYRYGTQVSILNRIADTFSLARGYFDDTNNVMEDRDLNRRWRGLTFTKKLKADMAVLLEKRVTAPPSSPGIILLNDPRQLNQMTVVDKQLKAATTVEGHGDAFWSNGLAVKAASDGPEITEISRPSPQPEIIHSPRQSWARQFGVV